MQSFDLNFVLVFTVPVNGSVIKTHHINPDNNRSSIFSIRFSPCGKYFVGGCNDAHINIYDRATETRTHKLKVINFIYY